MRASVAPGFAYSLTASIPSPVSADIMRSGARPAIVSTSSSMNFSSPSSRRSIFVSVTTASPPPMSSASARYRSILAVEKFSFSDIIMKSVSKLTASVCEVRRAAGSRRSKCEKRGSTSSIIESPCALWRNLTKSPVIGLSGSDACSSDFFAPFMSSGAAVFMRPKADFFFRASISPSASLQTRW